MFSRGLESTRRNWPVRRFSGGSMISGGLMSTWRMKGMSSSTRGRGACGVPLLLHGDQADVGARGHLPVDAAMLPGDVLADVAVEAPRQVLEPLGGRGEGPVGADVVALGPLLGVADEVPVEGAPEIVELLHEQVEGAGVLQVGVRARDRLGRVLERHLGQVPEQPQQVGPARRRADVGPAGRRGSGPPSRRGCRGTCTGPPRRRGCSPLPEIVPHRIPSVCMMTWLPSKCISRRYWSLMTVR